MAKKASTKETQVYGASDDLIEFDGGFTGEVSCYGTDDRDNGVLVTMSDGTILEVQYGKNDAAVWEVKLLRQGPLFIRIDQCCDEDADPHSDVAHFKPGIEWAYAATGDWEKVA